LQTNLQIQLHPQSILLEIDLQHVEKWQVLFSPTFSNPERHAIGETLRLKTTNSLISVVKKNAVHATK